MKKVCVALALAADLEARTGVLSRATATAIALVQYGSTGLLQVCGCKWEVTAKTPQVPLVITKNGY